MGVSVVRNQVSRDITPPTGNGIHGGVGRWDGESRVCANKGCSLVLFFVHSYLVTVQVFLLFCLLFICIYLWIIRIATWDRKEREKQRDWQRA